MIDFMFFVKTFFLTVAVVLLMQIHIGDKTIEAHTMGFVQSSTIAAPLNSVAQGAGKMIHDVVKGMNSGIHQNRTTAKTKKEGHRWTSMFKWHNSETPKESEANSAE